MAVSFRIDVRPELPFAALLGVVRETLTKVHSVAVQLQAHTHTHTQIYTHAQTHFCSPWFPFILSSPSSALSPPQTFSSHLLSLSLISSLPRCSVLSADSQQIQLTTVFPSSCSSSIPHRGGGGGGGGGRGETVTTCMRDHN